MMIIPKNIVNYLHLKEVGFLEMTFALTPMLSGFGFMGQPLSFWMWAVLIAIIILRRRHNRFKNFIPLTIFIIYWSFHELYIMLVDDVNFAGVVEQILLFTSAYFLFPNLDAKKLKGCMNWVAILAMGGLLYQWTFILRGQGIHPLELPGLPRSEFFLEKISLRPSSFFNEPAAYVAFMICPLALSLIEKKYHWAVAIILSIFLTTSTTGLVLSFILLGASLFVQKKVKMKTSLGILLIGGGLFFALTHFSAFRLGVAKAASIDASTNVRISQAPYIVSTMYFSEYLFGAPYSTPYNYCISGRAPDVIYYGNTVYMSTFWSMILLYGVIGLILYLNIYYRIFRMSKVIWPLLACLLATMFSDPDNIQGGYIYKLIFMLVLAIDDVKERFRPNNSLVK